jgi:4-hydroxybenzoate polyprenyltransferase
VVGREAAVGFVTVFLLFLQLRILDEFKDEELDAEHHPERPVQRGLVTLKELRRVALLALAAQLALHASLGAQALVLVLGLLLFTALTGREFFLGERLRRNFLVYTLAHMTVLPALACYVYGLVILRADDAVVHPAFALFLALSYLAGLLLELARKTRSPGTEREGVYSYTKHLGTRGLSDLAAAILVVASACCLGIGVALAFGVSYHAAVWALFLVAAAGFARFRFSPTPRAAGRVSTVYAPVYVLGVYGAIIVHVLVAA